MTRCLACQHENPPEARFCVECGTRLERACPRCGHMSPTEHKFCPECGQQLIPAAGSTQRTLDSSPATYTPPHLAQKILTARSTLEGERKLVTVLFCDLQGSTPLAERIGPERMHEILNRFFELALAAVHRYEGTVNQFLGDGFMALFGAPVAHEDHALRAALAALELRQNLRSLNTELDPQGTPLHIRMGINTGPVVVGSIGDNLRMDYTAVGDTTNLASRLQTMADPDTILSSEATYALVQFYLDCVPLGAREVKGKSQPVMVFRIDGARERRTRFDRSLEQGLTGFVGREQEMGLLQSRWEEVLLGRGQVVLLVGEAGVGKSRLLFEFRQSLPADALALEGRCFPYERGIPYAPVAELLQRYFGLAAGEQPEAVRQQVRTHLEQLGGEVGEMLPFLLNLLSQSVESASLASLESGQVKRLTQEAVAGLLCAISRKRPLCLTVEDGHWADPSSKELLSHLAGSVSGTRILLCLATRPGGQWSFEGRTTVSQVVLNPLSDEEATAVAARLLSSQELPSAVRELIVKRTGGYPLYLEEMIRSLLAKGQLLRTNAGLTVAASLSETEIPETIHDIIMARVDQLEGATRQLLQVASVAGEEFDFALLQAITQTTPETLLQQLDQLKAQEFIVETAAFPRRRYAFRHSLVQETAYGSLLQRRRSEWHELVGTALEGLMADEMEECLPSLADHYARSANRDKALHYLLRAADQATRQYAHGQAQAHLERAVALLDTGPDEAGTRRRVLDRLGEAHFAQGALAPALAVWDRALEVALAAGEHGSMAALHRKIAVAHWSLGSPDVAETHLMRGLGCFQGEPDSIECARLLQELGRLAFRLGRHGEATRWAEQALALGERLEASDVVSHASNTLGLALARSGAIERGADAVTRSLETALAHDLHSAACRAYANLAVLYTAIDQDRSAAYCAAGLELARKIGDLMHQSWLQCTLASRSCTLVGDYQEGVRAAEASIELDRRLGQRSHLPIPLILLAQIHQCHGAFDESERYYREALALAEEVGDPQLLIPCCDGLATLAIERGDEPQAAQYLERSQQLIERTGWASDSLLVLPFLS